MHRRVRRAVALGDPFAQRREAFRRAVLQRFPAACRQHPLHGRQRFLDRECFRGRKPTRKGNHFGALGHLEDFANCRTLDCLRPGGENRVEIWGYDAFHRFLQGTGFHEGRSPKGPDTAIVPAEIEQAASLRLFPPIVKRKDDQSMPSGAEVALPAGGSATGDAGIPHGRPQPMQQLVSGFTRQIPAQT